MASTLSGLLLPLVPSLFKASQSSFYGDQRAMSLSFLSRRTLYLAIRLPLTCCFSSFKICVRCSTCFTRAGKFSHDCDSKSSFVAESDKVLVPGIQHNASSLTDKDMYDFMALDRPSNPVIDRGMALDKMIRLITMMGLGGEGYLNFMGNEFGHPEWIDFPRGDQHLPSAKVPGNNNSFDKCRRRFDLRDAEYLRYRGMQEFDQAMQHLEEKFHFMTPVHQYISRKDEGDKIIVFERGDLVFMFNFHWSNSYFDDRIGCVKTGKYKIVLDSDDPLFGGSIGSITLLSTLPLGQLSQVFRMTMQEGWYDDRPHSFLVYAPARTAVVYALAD